MSYKKWLPAMLSMVLWGCEELTLEPPAENELLDGPIEGLNPTQQQAFLSGDIAFNDEIFSPATGLGPIFVSTSCGGCHVGDGKGHPSTTLTRFGRMQNGTFDRMLDAGGPQLQNRAIPGFIAEEIPPEATGITRLVAPSVTGLGLIEAVPDQTLIDLVAQQKAEGVVSGELNYVTPPEFFQAKPHHQPNAQGQYIGRFGKKSGSINLLHQTVNAYKQDIGVTSDFDIEDPINFAVAEGNVDPVGDPEIPAATVETVVFYLQTLKPPLRRNPDDPLVQAGEDLFESIGCANCHLPTLQSGVSNIASISQKEFHPYTDLLMHDMGPQLDDGFIESTEKSGEWRTPPLWGIGLAADSQGGAIHLMHDGRAKSLEEAILLHGGEANASRESFQQLTSEQQEQVLAFLRSL